MTLSVPDLCDEFPEEVQVLEPLFTDYGKKFLYLRHIINNQELPVANLLAAHFQQLQKAFPEENGEKSSAVQNATDFIIHSLRDDYTLLMDVLTAISDTLSHN